MDRRHSLASQVEAVLARVRSLRDRRTRDAQRRYWIEGVRHFVQACDAGRRFDAVIDSPILLKSDLAEMLARRLAARGVPRFRVSPEQFRSICTTGRASGIGAIVAQHWSPLSEADPAGGTCFLVIEEIRSPGNLGTILRTAEATGVGGIIFVGPQCDPFAPDVLRASMGGLFHLTVSRTSPQQLARWAAQRGVRLVGLSPEADRLWTELPDGPVALVLGEERSGLSDSLRAICHTAVRLPMTGRADSLNVGVAAGVMMYELVRRAAVTSSSPSRNRPRTTPSPVRPRTTP